MTRCHDVKDIISRQKGSEFHGDVGAGQIARPNCVLVKLLGFLHSANRAHVSLDLLVVRAPLVSVIDFVGEIETLEQWIHLERRKPRNDRFGLVCRHVKISISSRRKKSRI